mmetsp:Transcript_19409/g.43699  ORF Transcript_19409/g.43699 Transcript_19409/m.43699 type:complete len:423 (-) Transcript_19409:150-1418(-)
MRVVGLQEDDSDDDVIRGEVHYVDEEGGRSCSSSSAVPTDSSWPRGYKPLKRIRFKSAQQASEVLKQYATAEEPFILEGVRLINVDRWYDVGFITQLLKDKKLLVKKSPDEHFRYFDLKKNTGNFAFEAPVAETQMTFADFVAEGRELLNKDSPERMYLQETLCGHDELAQEFASWNWELLLVMSRDCGWGLPDSNELFVGMQGVETPLHYDEKENLFFQVRGCKEVCLFPWTDYVRLYPFPMTHPCDRQSMVGNPRAPDLKAFPRFREASGHVGELNPGDLLYIPYGWWHWFRNVDHLAVSVSFWSKTRGVDFSSGVPEKFTQGMITRVRRNLESLVAQDQALRLNEEMLHLRQAILEGRQQDSTLVAMRSLLAAVKIPVEIQDRFLLEIIEGRFGIDWQRHVSGGGLASVRSSTKQRSRE